MRKPLGGGREGRWFCDIAYVHYYLTSNKLGISTFYINSAKLKSKALPPDKVSTYKNQGNGEIVTHHTDTCVINIFDDGQGKISNQNSQNFYSHGFAYFIKV